jgi:hypothetical protein
MPFNNHTRQIDSLENECLPSHFVIVGQKLVNGWLNTNEPRWNSLVDQRGIRTPAEGITVHDLRLNDQSVLLLQVLLNDLVGFL